MKLEKILWTVVVTTTTAGAVELCKRAWRATTGHEPPQTAWWEGIFRKRVHGALQKP
jgi:hypothetical protein